MDFLARVWNWHQRDFVVEGHPRETLDRVEAYILRSGYDRTRPSTNVSAHFHEKTGGRMTFLGFTDYQIITVVVSSEGEGQTRLTVQTNYKAKEVPQRILADGVILETERSKGFWRRVFGG
jgi:hypothetical protein